MKCMNYKWYQKWKRHKGKNLSKTTIYYSIIEVITISLVIYHGQQQLVPSHGGKNLCAQIASNIVLEDDPPSWSHGQWTKHYTPSFLYSAFEHARNWLHMSGLYRLQQCENIYEPSFQISQFILSQPTYNDMFPYWAIVGSTQALAFTLSR